MLSFDFCACSFSTSCLVDDVYPVVACLSCCYLYSNSTMAVLGLSLWVFIISCIAAIWTIFAFVILILLIKRRRIQPLKVSINHSIAFQCRRFSIAYMIMLKHSFEHHGWYGLVVLVDIYRLHGNAQLT